MVVGLFTSILCMCIGLVRRWVNYLFNVWSLLLELYTHVCYTWLESLTKLPPSHKSWGLSYLTLAVTFVLPCNYPPLQAPLK